MPNLGPSFPDEYAAAGLVGSPLSVLSDGTFIRNDATDAQVATLQTLLAAHDPTKPAPVVIPNEVTRYQARYILAQQGMLAQVQAYFDGLPDTDMGKLAWNEAPSVRRDSEAFIAAAHSLGLTDQKIDEMLIAAGQVL